MLRLFTAVRDLLRGGPTDPGALLAARPRSPRWPAVRKAHLLREPSCAACGHRVELDVHHVLPFHLRPALELLETNLLTLCASPCHLWLGHLGHWASYNRDVRADAAYCLTRIRNRP